MSTTNNEPLPRGQKILIFGATGTIGKDIIEALVNSKKDFEKIGLFTSLDTVQKKPDFVETLRKQGVEIITGDVDDDSSVLQAYKGYDTIVSAVGRNAIDKQLGLIRLAESSPNITRFLPSEYGTDIEFDASSATEKPHQKKIKVRALLRSDDVSRLRYTFVVTGPFIDTFLPWAFDAEKKEASITGDGTSRISFISQADVGRAVVAVLLQPEVGNNRAVIVNSFTTTPNDILAEYEKQTGSKWKASYTPLEEWKKLEDEAWENENPRATGFTLRRIWAEGKTLYSKTDNAALGLKDLDTVEAAVKKALKQDA